MTARKIYRAALLEACALTNSTFQVLGRHIHANTQLPMDVDLSSRVSAIRLSHAKHFRQSGHYLLARAVLKK